jgi:hypothetical protein
MSEFGYEEGEVCARKGCCGVIEQHEKEGCSCHISPPCHACTEPRNFCPECDWEEKNDTIINDFKVNVDPKSGVYKCWEPRPLDPTKLDYRSRSHSNSSMIKEGVYPEGMAMAQVLEEVRGTFGGRFEYFGSGKFKYIAYTD